MKHSHQKTHPDFKLGLNQSEKYIEHYLKAKHNHSRGPNLLFSIFAKKVADIVGNAWSFMLAMLIIILWASAGFIFKFSDTWQLVINTGTTIVTFLIVFLIQNTQNRDTEILNLKIDELIRANKAAKNSVLDLSDLSDVELKELEKVYKKLRNKHTGE